MQLLYTHRMHAKSSSTASMGLVELFKFRDFPCIGVESTVDTFPRVRKLSRNASSLLASEWQLPVELEVFLRIKELRWRANFEQ